MEHEGDGNINSNWCTSNNPQRISKGIERLENKKTNRNHPDNSIIKIDQITEKSPGDLGRLAVTLTTVENHQLTIVSKSQITMMVKYYQCDW